MNPSEMFDLLPREERLCPGCTYCTLHVSIDASSEHRGKSWSDHDPCDGDDNKALMAYGSQTACRYKRQMLI